MTELAIAMDQDERKRLGQFFTGEPLARVLASLASAQSAASLIDPMAGSGDMLVGARAVGAAAARLTAVEIDPVASSRCADRLSERADVRTADAFDVSTWTRDAEASWDLVITNPPYVRYQRTSRGASGRISIPSASEVRQGLVKIIESRELLSTTDRELFRTLALGYSGLADLAVPSWLLCASLVAPDGRLAMVVPDTWLSRDYALPVLYLLRRCFEIEFVVEDGEASWFEDALVRTTLVVARRVETRPTAIGDDTCIHTHARLTAAATDHRSVVGSLHPRSKEPEQRFTDRLRTVVRTGTPLRSDGLEAEPVSDAEFRDRLLAQAGATSWGRSLEPSLAAGGKHGGRTYDIPRRLRDAMGEVDATFRTLDQMGWKVGQGLRTGANRFFYGEVLEVDGGVSQVRFDAELSPKPLAVPTCLTRVAVRKQSDLVAAGGDLECSPGRLLLLDSYALAEDIAASSAAGVHVPYVSIPEPLGDFVRRAAQLNVGSDEAPRRVPELSAVTTNVREADPMRPERAPRFWYQLPPLAQRHTGALLIPRINYAHPVVTTNCGGVVVDANFSTLWAEEDALPVPAVQALLGSTWCRAAMECAGTVLGGGALKIEATQLRRLPLPTLDAATADQLSRLGASLGSSPVTLATMQAIDSLIWEALGISGAARRAVERLGNSLLAARHPRLQTVA